MQQVIGEERNVIFGVLWLSIHKPVAFLVTKQGDVMRVWLAE